MKDSGKKYKIVWKDGDIYKAREGYGYEYEMENQPWLVNFHLYNGEDLVVSTNFLVAIEPVKERNV